MEAIFQTMLRDHDKFLKEISDISDVIFKFNLQAESPNEKLEVLKNVIEVYIKLSRFTHEFDKHWTYTVNNLFVLSKDAKFLADVDNVKKQREEVMKALRELQEALSEYREMKRSLRELAQEAREAIMRVRLTLLEHTLMEEKLIMHLITTEGRLT